MKKALSYKPLLIALLVMAYLLVAGAVWRLVDAKHITPLQAVVHSKDSATAGVVQGTTYKGFDADLQQPYYFTAIFFTGDTASLEKIDLYINDDRITILPQQLAATSTQPQKYSLTNFLPKQRSMLPVFKQFVNWAGDGALLGKLLFHPLPLFFLLALLLLRWWRRRTLIQQLPAMQPAEFAGNKRIWHAAGLLLFVLCCGILLQSDQYYFLQDDNYAQFTPVIINGLDGWYQQGSLPVFNPYQLTGVPTFSYSTYAFLYPGTHLSYLVAKYLLGDVYQFNNVFALLHFAIGYWFIYRLLLKLRIHPLMAITGAICFVFCGFNLIAARSWYYVAPAVAFAPLLCYYTLCWQQKPGIKYPVLLGLLFGLFAYGGNFQYWVYSFLFFAAYSIFRGTHHFWPAVSRVLVTGVTALLIFLPQLLATFMETAGLDRAGGEGQGIWEGIGSLLLPGYNSQLPNGWGRSDLHGFDAHFYYGGFIFLIPALLCVFYWLLYKQAFTLLKSFRVLLLLFALAFILSLGRPGLLWPVLAKLPLFNKFNHPFKLLLFVQFFGIITGALCWQYAVQQLLPLRRVKWLLLLLPATLIFMAWHVGHTRQGFYVYSYVQPYKKISWQPPAPWSKPYRIVPLGPLRSPDTGFDASLQLNFAMMHGLVSADGYEPLNRVSPNLFAHHREWGIRYFVQSLHQAEPTIWSQQNGRIEQFKHAGSFQLVYTDKNVAVYEDSLYEPTIQLRNRQDNIITTPLTLTYRNNGLEIHVQQPVQEVSSIILAWHWRPGLHALLNGRRVALQQDSIGRSWLPVNEPFSNIKLIFKPFSK